MSSSMVLGALLVSLAVAFAMPATGEEKFAPTLQGSCPDFKGIAPPEGTKLDGEWHGVYVLKKGFEKKGAVKCVKKTVTAKPDGSFDSVLSAIKDGTPKSMNIHATPIAGQTGKFTLKKDKPDATDDATMTKTGTLIAVDDKYLLDILCGTDGTKHGFMVSVYSRQATLDAGSLDKAKSALQAAGINDELTPVEGC